MTSHGMHSLIWTQYQIDHLLCVYGVVVMCGYTLPVLNEKGECVGIAFRKRVDRDSENIGGCVNTDLISSMIFIALEWSVQ